MEGEAADHAEAASGDSLVGRHQRLRRVLDRQQSTRRSDGVDCIHFARNTGIVCNEDRLCAGVIACSIFISSILRVSGRISMNTGIAPRSTTAFADETKVNDGTPQPLDTRVSLSSP